MNNRYHRSHERKNGSKAESTGWRQTFYYPGGGTYRGCWLKSQHHLFGVKESKNGLIYDGQWQNGKRHGYGEMRHRAKDGTMRRIYIGQWCDDLKSGEGKQFYENGVYYGWWKYNRRHGLGIEWYNTGDIYVGEWQADFHHGLGVLLYANGNRYEGNFSRGLKSGEGTFYHVVTGQIQKGMWESGICKVSMLQHNYGNQGESPTAYYIPKLRIANPSKLIHDLFEEYKRHPNTPSKSLQEQMCLNLIRRIKDKFEPFKAAPQRLSY